MAYRGIIICMLLAGVAFGQAFLTPFDPSLLQLAESGDPNDWFSADTPTPNIYWRPGLTGLLYGTATGDAYTLTGTGWVFDGTGDGIIFPTNSAYTGLSSGSFTAGCWVKFNSFGDNQHIIFNGDNDLASSLEWNILYFQSTGKYRFYTANGGSISFVESAASAVTGVWTHVVGKYDVATDKTSIYVDSSKTVSASTVNNGNAGLAGLGIGASVATGQKYINGYVDEVPIWSSALTDAQIGAWYTNSLNAEFSTR